ADSTKWADFGARFLGEWLSRGGRRRLGKGHSRRAPMIRITSIALGTGAFIAMLGPASALTMKECSTKYEAAKTAGSLNGMKWNDFRKTECGSDASAATTARAPANIAPPTSSAAPAPALPARPKRSEEHTSELQSQ